MRMARYLLESRQDGNVRKSERLFRAIKNPRLFARGSNRLYHRLRRRDRDFGVAVFEEDWDNLVVLDACRFDMFESRSQLEGTLSSKSSKGSSTVEWLQANFNGRDLRDTVYVTANPQLELNRSGWDITLHDVKNIWLDEGWDDETGTVRAETVNEATMEAIEQYPKKRLVVHYMQPHYPFVMSNTEFDKNHLNQLDECNSQPATENVWNQKFAGDLNVSRDDLWSMYAANLEYVLEHVAELLPHLSGKTVVTSDHGNYVGERASPLPIREYGPPRGLYDEPVVRVPWLEIKNGNRRKIHSGTALEAEADVQDDIITDRLQDLGYRQ